MARDPKEMIAVRIDPADKRRLKALAERLEVNESDLLRYAVKVTLADFAPLSDHALEGAELIGAFIEHGADKARWLDLDAEKVDRILHADLQNESLRVSKDDIRVALGAYSSPGYAEWAYTEAQKVRPSTFRERTPEQYLYQKYVEPLEWEKRAEEEEETHRRLEG